MAYFTADYHTSRRWAIFGVSLRIALVTAIMATLIVSLRFDNIRNHYFGYLANALAHRSFSVNDLPAYYSDWVQQNGNVYLPLSPMPGIMLLPCASVLGLACDEIWLAYFFTAANVLAALILLKRLHIPKKHHRYLLALFFLGTIYLSALAMGRGWFLAHIIASTFLLFAILETLSRQRVVIIGAWLGLAFLTRAPTIFALPFFLWMLKPARVAWLNWRFWLAQGFQLALGALAPMLFFFDYNYSRFGNLFETGYAHAIVVNPVLTEALQQGLFSPVHLAKNLYALFLAMPQAYPSFSAPVLQFPYIYPSPWGMGIFFTTPAFVYALAANWRERLVRAAWLAVGLVLIPLVTYYGVGWIQFGYRYALDFYPFLFVLTALGITSHFDWKARALVVLSIVINIWGAWWQMVGFLALPMSLLK
jgi:hypothetical protein